MIDSHHHLWSYSPREYAWIDDSMTMLRRDFLPADLVRVAAEAGVDGTVAVQARQTLEETDWLLSIAENSPLLRGVVGWAPIASADFPAQLDRLKSNKKLKGLRHVIQGEHDDNYINRPDFNRGIKMLAGSSLVYDILIFEKHLGATVQFVDRHPNQVFVLDHIAKPRIREAVLEPWKRNICELARRPNVYCKLSGLVTEAQWFQWSEADLRPYVDVVLDAFTPSRLMFGSDWPVCLLATTYRKWFESFSRLIDQLSATEKAQVMGDTAIKVYHLQD
ncbi:MAG: amidohydrolase family protein [Terriglobales bacterium]|jgi:L-fuconolactonase|nr:amidohydrolase family protein [Terriglobales bacterium]